MRLRKILSNLTFVNDIGELDTKDAFVAKISADVKNDAELFDILHEKLNFPWYDGKNGNALAELLGDFHWISKKNIIIYHEGLPIKLFIDDLRTYLRILTRSVENWKNEPRSSEEFYKEWGFPKHELIAVFPTSSKDEIKKILC